MTQKGARCLTVSSMMYMMLVMRRPKLERSDVMRVAAEAEVDPRSVTRWCAGLSMKSIVQARIERAVVTLKLNKEART